jgi:hypothetical protein
MAQGRPVCLQDLGRKVRRKAHAQVKLAATSSVSLEKEAASLQAKTVRDVLIVPT